MSSIVELTKPANTANVPYKADVSDPQRWWRRHHVVLLLSLILLLAAFFRFYGNNFDQSHNQHPDERFIVGRTLTLQWPRSIEDLFDVRTSPLNLRSTLVDRCPPAGCTYPYGSLPVYLTRATGWLLDTVLPPSDTLPKGYFLQGYEGTTLLGRHLSSLFDLFTILLVFLIGRRLYSKCTGLIAAALVAFAVTHIQIAHFYASDSFLVAFMMGALYFSVVMMQSPSLGAAIGAGTCIGLAVASKVSVVPFALVVVAAVVLRSAYRRRTRILGAEFGDPVGVRPAGATERALPVWSHFLRGSRFILVAGVCALLAFAITDPYVLWSFDFSQFATGGQREVFLSNPWGQGILEQTDIQGGKADMPYTRQYVGTPPLLYTLQQMIFWGLSPIPGLIVLAGFAFGVWRAFRRRPAELLLVAGAIPYFATILTLEAKWMRYILPLVPIFCLLGAAMLVRGITWERLAWARRFGNVRVAPILLRIRYNVFALLTALAIGGAFLWSVAFINIYTQDHSRQQASQWIYDNVPVGSRHSGEVWDDALPLGPPEAYGKRQPLQGSYFGPDVSFDLYPDRAPQDALNYLREQMAQTDYIFIASNRLYGSLPHLPWRYPVQTRFYDLLFAEKLGYIRVHTEHVTPELFGIRFDDQSADESFTVYDHPRVDFFKKVTTLTDNQLRTLFSTALNRPVGEYSTDRHGSVTDSKSLSYDQPVSSLPDVGDYSWNPLAQEETQWIGVLLWLVAVYVIGFAALPLVFAVSRNLPDRAYPVSKIAGLLLVSWGTWMAANVRLLPFTVWSVLLMLMLLAGVSLLCWRLGIGREIRLFFREKRRLVLFYEAVFLAAFAAFLFIRILNPDLWHPVQGGEKPMEIGFLNATLRSPWMPPLDPFFSGGYINYYYYGYFVVGCLIKLVGVNPAIAFNLAIPLLYALAMSGAVSVVYNIVAWSQRDRGNLRPVSSAGLAFGLLSGILMLVIGNLQGFYQLLRIQLPQVADLVVNGLARIGFTTSSLTGNYTTFDFWGPSRIIPRTINEFPFWTYLFADLHPHLIDMPFTLLGLVLAVNLAFAVPRFFTRSRAMTTDATIDRQGLRHSIASGLGYLWGTGWRGIANFGLLAIVLGALAVTNSWDYPTFAAIAGAAAIVALLRLRRAAGDSTDEASLASARDTRTAPMVYMAALVSIAVVALTALLAYLPFFLSFKAFYTEIVPLVDGEIISGTAQVMSRTTLPEFILVWAVFLFITMSYLIMRLWQFPWRAAFGDVRNLVTPYSTRPALRPVPANTSWSTWGLFSSRRPALATASTGALSKSGATLAYWTESPPSGQATEDGRGDVVTSPEEEGRELSSQILPLGTDADALSEQMPTPEGVGVQQIPLVTEPPYATESEQNGKLVPDYIGTDAYSLPRSDNWLAAAYHRETAAAAPRLPNYPGVLPLPMGLFLLGMTALLTALQLATGQYLLALLVALIGGVAATTLSTSRSASSLFTGALLLMALAVALGVELVFLADHLRGGDSYRMNTVFKFYVQVWVLFAAGSAGAVYHMIFGLREHRQISRETASRIEQTPIPPVDETVEISPNSEYPGIFPLQAEAPDEASLLVPRDTAPLEKQVLDNWLVWSSEDAMSALPVIETLPKSNGTSEVHAEVVKPVPSALGPSDAHLNLTPSRIAWAGLFTLLLTASLVYTLLGTRARVMDRFPVSPPVGTLNGMKYMTVGTFTTDAAPLPINLKYDYEAINWMNKNIHGTRVIAEIPLGYYREDGMRVASNTGFPMVVGGLHQGEQRAGTYDRLVADRGGDMNEFFTTTDIQRALILISKYDIDYIYVGQLEVARGTEGIAKFKQMAEPKVGILKEVFRNGDDKRSGSVVYEVVKDARTIAGAPVANSGIPGISITPLPTTTPTPAPTPPVDDPTLKALIAEVAAKPTDREARLKLADWYTQHKFFVAAANELETVVTQDPQNIAARHMLGDAYQQAGQPDRALKAWEDARDADPNNPAAHNKLGIAYMERQRVDDAIREFQAATASDANFVESWLHLGEAYETKGNKDKAREAYTATIDRSTEPNTWSDLARQRLGKLK